MELPVEKFMDFLEPRMLIRDTETVADAVRRLGEGEIYALIVVDDEQQLKGVVTVSDLSRLADKRTAKLSDVLTTRPIAATAGQTISSAMDQMEKNKIATGLPVLEPGTRRPIGFLNRFRLPDQLRRELPRA